PAGEFRQRGGGNRQISGVTADQAAQAKLDYSQRKLQQSVTMDEMRRRVARQTLAITLACIAGSVAITAAVTYAGTGSLDLGIGLLIAVLAPAIIVPIGSYNHIS